MVHRTVEKLRRRYEHGGISSREFCLSPLTPEEAEELQRQLEYARRRVARETRGRRQKVAVM